VFDEQLLFGCLLDGARDSLPVLRSEDEGAQDKQIQCALQEVQSFFLFSGRHVTRACASTGKMSTQKEWLKWSVNATSLSEVVRQMTLDQGMSLNPDRFR